MLEGEGFEVVHAENGARALEILSGESSAFSLIVTDLMMPEMDGLALMDHLSADERLHAIPVLVCTAKDDRETVREALGRGARGYLDKHGTDHGKLVGTVRRTLGLGPRPPDPGAWGHATP